MTKEPKDKCVPSICTSQAQRSAHAQLEVLVTTNRTVDLVAYRPTTQQWASRTLLSRHGLFFGCDWDTSHLYVGGRDDVGTPSRTLQGEVIIRLSRDLEFIDVWYRSRELRDIHQICVVEGSLWVTNTYHNLIRIIRIADKSVIDFAPNPRRWSPPGSVNDADWNHFNSIRYDGSTVYVVANNAMRATRRPVRSEVYEIDPLELKVKRHVRLDAYTAHDVWKEGFGWRTCDSLRGAIVEDLKGRKAKAVIELQPWLRGVAISQDFMFVGRSVYGSQETRTRGDSVIYAIDRTNGSVVSEHSIRNVGQILDMCLLNVPDLARFDRAPFHSDRSGRPAP